MENHFFFARRQISLLGARGKEKYESMWEDLTEQLNFIGRTIKTVSSWKDVRIYTLY